MTTRRRVCLVTDELYPFTPGGIGRLVHNQLLDNRARGDPVEMHVLVPAGVDVDRPRMAAVFGDAARLHVWAFEDPVAAQGPDDAPEAPASAFTSCPEHAQSRRLLQVLRAMERKGLVFDVIEFPDYRGLGFCSIQEKRLGGAFERTEIAVRVHGTLAMIQHFDYRPLSRELLAVMDLERKALLDAERVIAHLPSVVAAHTRLLGLPEAWASHVTIEFPPVLSEKPPAPPPPPRVRDLVFASRIQEVKRPDLFIRGSAEFMRACPGFKGRAVLACSAPDPAYREMILGLVPPDLRRRFAVAGGGLERDKLLASGIVVVPSDYESLCLVAYEAAAAGGVLVLNSACPAFDSASPFQEGKNCCKFDGTVQGLERALERALHASTPLVSIPAPEAPYWERPAPAPARRSRAPSKARVSVIITNHNLGQYLPETLASVAANDHPDVEVIVVDDASTAAVDRPLLDRIEREAAEPGSRVRLLRNPVNRGLSASRNRGIREAKGDYVLILDADDCISPAYIGLAARALDRNPEFDVVVSTAGFFRTDGDLARREFFDYATFIGDCPSLGLVENRFGCATAVFRRSLFDELAYDERMPAIEDWTLYLRLAHRGRRFLVTNDVHFFYRRRPGSMSAQALTAAGRAHLIDRMIERHPDALPRGVRLGALMHGYPAAGAPPAPPPAPSIPLRYSLADRGNEVLKIVPPAHLRAKETLNGWLAWGGPPREAPNEVWGTPNWIPGTPKPVRYQLVDTLNALLKSKLPILHPLLKDALAALGR